MLTVAPRIAHRRGFGDRSCGGTTKTAHKRGCGDQRRYDAPRAVILTAVADFPEPGRDVGDQAQVLLGYLDFFRSTVHEKVSGLPDDVLSTGVLPSGWTPLELVQHLAYMERRWLVWGFLAEQVPDPWDDADESGRWRVTPGADAATVAAMLEAGGRRTREIVEAAGLSDHARVGGRFTADDPRPTLERILLHVLQEYARHAGHLDVVRELVDGRVGE